MDLFLIIKYVLLFTSFGTLVLSLIFLLFPDLYSHIEEVVNSEVLESTDFFTVLEGKINFLNDWIFKNRLIFGSLFVLLSLYNINSLVAL